IVRGSERKLHTAVQRIEVDGDVCNVQARVAREERSSTRGAPDAAGSATGNTSFDRILQRVGAGGDVGSCINYRRCGHRKRHLIVHSKTVAVTGAGERKYDRTGLQFKR